jgi:hypothetical protein
MSPEGRDGLIVSNELHKKPERAQSFNVAMRQLVSDFLRCDYAASRLILTIPEDEAVEPLPVMESTLPIGAAIRDIANRGFWPMPYEKTMFDGFRIAADKIVCERQQAIIMKTTFVHEFSLKVDAPTRSFEVGFSLG